MSCRRAHRSDRGGAIAIEGQWRQAARGSRRLARRGADAVRLRGGCVRQQAEGARLGGDGFPTGAFAGSGACGGALSTATEDGLASCGQQTIKQTSLAPAGKGNRISEEARHSRARLLGLAAWMQAVDSDRALAAQGQAHRVPS